MLYILALFAISAWAQTADLMVVNARIYTLNPAQPIASRLAVKDGKILAIGGTRNYAGPQTRTIDAHGAAIYPGFIDSHGHMQALGESLATLDLRGAKSQEQVAEMVRKAAAVHQPGDWITGWAWDQNNWPGKQFPTWESLSAAAPENPVYLERVDGHAGWTNRKAL